MIIFCTTNPRAPQAAWDLQSENQTLPISHHHHILQLWIPYTPYMLVPSTADRTQRCYESCFFFGLQLPESWNYHGGLNPQLYQLIPCWVGFDSKRIWCSFWKTALGKKLKKGELSNRPSHLSSLSTCTSRKKHSESLEDNDNDSLGWRFMAKIVNVFQVTVQSS